MTSDFQVGALFQMNTTYAILAEKGFDYYIFDIWYLVNGHLQFEHQERVEIYDPEKWWRRIA